MVPGHGGHDVGRERGVDGAGRGDRLVERRRHADRAAAVHTPDRRDAPAALDRRHVAERNLVGVRGPDAHVLELAERPALVGGIADHDPDVVAAALDALRLLPVERLPDLPADVLQREPERLGGGLDADAHLPRSALERVGDVVHAGKAAQTALHALHGRPQQQRVGRRPVARRPLRPAAGRTPRTPARPLPESGRSARASAGRPRRPARRARRPAPAPA